jgi:catechol 2,3-dioxygenase-like lactoylglutathione lyase family enzyme
VDNCSTRDQKIPVSNSVYDVGIPSKNPKATPSRRRMTDGAAQSEAPDRVTVWMSSRKECPEEYGMSKILGIDHIDIVVADPEAMAAFLVNVGFSIHRRTAHGGGSIELIFPGEGEQPVLELTSQVDAQGKVRPLGLRHVALRADDVERAFEHFKSAGLTVTGEPRTVPDTGRRLINLRDPEGGTLQVVGA